MSLVKNDRISISDQKVDQKKWDDAPIWRKLGKKSVKRVGKKV